ncbi:MAG: UDP-N-acetylmuramoyl-L-alanine--D-glutamate ligase [Pseudomonadota bacterium]|nr:UDP-N-acetylmuramoyl-L-alanine--D-glutamate ligase [Pseudomonadota bacterium]
MIPVTSRFSQHIGVFGLGASGCATAQALIAGGAYVTAWDDNEEARHTAAKGKIPLKHPGTPSWQMIDTLILSPGVPLKYPKLHPVVQAAQSAGKPIIGDIDLIQENTLEAKFIGITGTNGKSTTAALIHHVLQKANLSVQLGGNFGTPALQLKPAFKNDTIILELSSYQLDLTQDAIFDIAVLLNITPDHLDRHGSMKGYFAAKKEIFRNAAAKKQLAVVGIDDPYGQQVWAELNTVKNWTVIPVSTECQTKEGVYVKESVLHDKEKNRVDLSGIDTLQGPHNWQNAAAAWAVLQEFKIPAEKIEVSFRTFPGLPHRLENIGEYGGIRYINDSKATNGHSSARALSTHTNIYWIAGGVSKNDGLKQTFPYLSGVRHAFLIGEAEDEFSEALTQRGVPNTKSGVLKLAVEQAREAATRADSGLPIILFSPACASFDQYLNFEKRGNHFCDIVKTLVSEADE